MADADSHIANLEEGEVLGEMREEPQAEEPPAEGSPAQEAEQP
jgi:hypothetical protein